MIRIDRSLSPLSLGLAAWALSALGASAAPQTWGLQYGTGGNDAVLELAAEGNGGCFAVGVTSGALGGPSAGQDDVFVTRLAADGTPLWTRQLGTSGFDDPGGAAADGAGGVFVVGNTRGAFSTTQGGPDGFIARVDAQGGLSWAFNVGTDEYDFLEAVVSDGASGALAVGKTWIDNSSGGGKYHLWLVRFDAGGNVTWTRTHAFLGDAQPWDAIADGQGGAFVGGAEGTGFPPFTSSDAFVSRVNAAGDLLWTRKFASSQAEAVQGLARDDLGGVYAAGWTRGALGVPKGGEDGFIARVDGLGNPLSMLQIGTPLDDRCWTVADDGLGGYVVAGETKGTLFGPYGGLTDAWLMRADASGFAPWALQLGHAGADFAFAVCRVALAEVVVAGATGSSFFGPYLGGGNDAWAARYDTCYPLPVTTVCPPAPNSTGQGAEISSLGSLEIENNDFTLVVSGCPAGQLGVFIMGQSPASLPFGDGVLCIGGSIKRLLPAVVTDATGAAALQLDFSDPNSSASLVTADSNWRFQLWYRDAASTGAGFNLSSALVASFCP